MQLLWLSCPLQLSAAALAANYCSLPPLARLNVKPNLLLMLDNSASAYDLAYTRTSNFRYCSSKPYGNCSSDDDCPSGQTCMERPGYCIDDSYVDTASYPGYFDQTTIYGYDTGRFVPIGTQSGRLLSGSDPSVTPVAVRSYLYVGMTGSRPNRVVSDFKASGNFLNWLLMSKLDLEKKALTGGKFQFDAGSTTGGTLTAESRGCQGNRFVKIVPPLDSEESPDPSEITFAIRGPVQPTVDRMGRVISGDGDFIYSAAYGGMSRIEIYDKRYNARECLVAVEDWFSKETLGKDPETLRKFAEKLSQDTYQCIGMDNIYEPGGGPDQVPSKGKTYIDVMSRCLTNPTDMVKDGVLLNDCILRLKSLYGNDPTRIVKGTGDDICAKGVSHPPTTISPSSNSGYLGNSYNFSDQSVSWAGTEEQQAEDYCRLIDGRILTDPSTGNQPGTNVDIPSFILDAGIYSLGKVAGTFQGRLYVPAQPTGLIQEYANDINFGAMIFNDNGSGSECKAENPLLPFAGMTYRDIPCVKRCSATYGVTFSTTECYIDADCPTAPRKYQCYEIPRTDGGKVIAPVSSTVGDHTAGLIASVDQIRASAWTPLAESFYNAIGYFAGRTDLRLQNGDFGPAPAALTCQKNDVLIISDGTSTADRAPAVNELVAYAVQSWGNGGGMPPSMITATSDPATPFKGSYNLDDLAWVAHNRNIADFNTPADLSNPNCSRNFLSTYVVYTGPACGNYDKDGNCTTTDEGIPEKLMQLTAFKGGGKIANARSSADLGKALRDTFRMIAAGSGAGTSILATGSGNGAIYLQEQFYPDMSFDQDKTSASWIGEMQSLWYYIDPFLWGSTGLASTIREDTDGDRQLNPKMDRIVSFRLDPTSGQSYAYLTEDPNGDGSGSATPTKMRADQLKSLWKAGQLLWTRDLTAAPRTIYTPLLPKGTPSANTGLMQFSAGAIGGTSLPDNSLALQPYLQVPDQASAVSLMKFVHGFDFPNDPTKRSRTVQSDTVTVPAANPGTTGVGVWKLGDIVSSTPQIESPVPLGSYHLAPPAGYNDGSYSRYICANPNVPCDSGYRDRGMVYVGANDGMLHAFNLGKVDSTVHGEVKAALTGDNLGQEQWAFIPKNALPYLTYLADPDYRHLYYVDGNLTLFDASIGDPNDGNCAPAAYSSCRKLPTSWRTVLIGGMGLGGASAASCAPGSNCVPTPMTDPFNAPLGYSSYFALDVTNPNKPTLLWEFSNPGLGFSTSGPAIVRISDPSEIGPFPDLNGRWFAVFGSGPTGPVDAPNRRFLANSNQELKFFVVDLRTGQLMATLPTGLTSAFAGSMSGGAIDIDRRSADAKGLYQDDAIYVGYSQMGTGPGGGWGGGVLRIVTKENSDPNQWTVSPVIGGTGPVTTGIARLQDRKNHDLWLYFGSGRYFYGQDDLQGPRALYGVREPCYNLYSGGVLTVKNKFDSTCIASVTGTLIDQSTSLHAVVGTDPGWVINLDPAKSLLNIGAERLSATPVSSTSGAVFFTTFQPSTDPCQYGSSYLWGVKYDTGGVMASLLEKALVPLLGKALVQSDTASVTDTALSGSFTDKDGRRSPPMPGRPSGVKLVTNVGLKPVKKIIHIQER